MTNIFESRHYPEIMYFLVLITIIAITFSFVNITNSINNSAEINGAKLTGYAVSENSNAQQPEIYSENSWRIYNIFFMSLYSLFSLVLVTFIFARIKHLT